MQTNKVSKGELLDGSFASMARFLLELLWVLVCSVPYFVLTVYKKLFPGEGKDVRNKIVLITGSANGLGKELSLQFARLGCKIACVDINESSNDKTVQQIITENGDKKSAKGYVCDVSNRANVKKLTEDVIKDFGHVDILINNAGIIYCNSILGGEDDNVQRVFDVNLMANYWMTRAFLPHMKKRREGHIVFMNSMASLTPVGNGAAYCSTKFGLLGLAWSVEDYLRKDPDCSNIKVTSAHPYFIGTDDWYTQNLFVTRVKPLETADAVRQIVTGIRREYANFQVPGLETGFWLSSLLRFIMPLKSYFMLRQVVKADFNTPTDTAYRNIPKRTTN